MTGRPPYYIIYLHLFGVGGFELLVYIELNVRVFDIKIETGTAQFFILEIIVNYLVLDF